ncbi:hypothetical protein WDU94_007914 [Cyamophila willieti]
MVCLSSDISTNLLVASIAEELTNTIKGIDINKTDRNKILTNLLEINSIVEKSKSSQKFSTFKSQLEEIQFILNEPIHKSWMEKILTKTQNLINFMMNSEPEIQAIEQDKKEYHSEPKIQPIEQEKKQHQSEPEIQAKQEDQKQFVDNDDIIRQCFNEWTEAAAMSSEHTKKENQTEYIDFKDSKVQVLHVSPKWNNSNSFVSESEVLIVNYSRIRHEKSRENVSGEIEAKQGADEAGDNDDVRKPHRAENKALSKPNNIVENKTLSTLQPNEETNKMTQDLSDLKRELKQVLLERLSQTKSPTFNEVQNKQQNNIGNTRDIKASEKESSSQKESSGICKCRQESTIDDCSRDTKEKIHKEDSRAKKREKRERKCNTASTKKHRTKDSTVYSANTSEGKTFNTRKKMNLLGNCKCSSHEKLKDVSCCTCEHANKNTSVEKTTTSRDDKIKDEPSRNENNSDKPSRDTTTPDGSFRDHTSDKPSKDGSNSNKSSRGHTTSDKFSRDHTTSEKPSRDESTSQKLSLGGNTSSQDSPNANVSMFKYLGQVCYETLLPGDEYSATKVDDILTMCEGKTLGKQHNLMCSGKLDKQSRKSTTKKHHRSRKEKRVNPDDVEDLKSRCASIRKQLESIESKAAMLKSRRKPKLVETLIESGDEDVKECHASNEGGHYMCTIM